MRTSSRNSRIKRAKATTATTCAKSWKSRNNRLPARPDLQALETDDEIRSDLSSSSADAVMRVETERRAPAECECSMCFGGVYQSQLGSIIMCLRSARNFAPSADTETI